MRTDVMGNAVTSTGQQAVERRAMRTATSPRPSIASAMNVSVAVSEEPVRGIFSRAQAKSKAHDSRATTQPATTPLKNGPLLPPIDIFLPQANDAPKVLGYMLADAIDGFPVPFYPRCLQRAHENAALVDFDMTILQDQVLRSVRTILGDHSDRLDELTLQPSDPSSARY